MHAETAERVAFLQARVIDASKRLDDVKTVLAGNDDPYINGLIRQAGFWLGDVDTHFVAMLKEQRVPPRTLSEELALLWYADMHMNSIAMPLVHQITDLVKKYGSTITSVGGG